MGEFVIL